LCVCVCVRMLQERMAWPQEMAAIIVERCTRDPLPREWDGG